MLAELPERMVQPLAAASHDALYLWGGFRSGDETLLGEGYRLDLATGSWHPTAPVPEGQPSRAPRSSEPMPRESWSREVWTGSASKQGWRPPPAKEQAAYLAMPPAHYAFNNRIRYFRFADETWLELGRSGRCAWREPQPPQTAIAGCTTSSAGEIKPRVRSPKIWKMKFMESLKRQNNIYPWIVVGLLWVVALLNYMDRQMLSTMKEAMQIDIAEPDHGHEFRPADGRISLDLRLREPLCRGRCRPDQPQMADRRLPAGMVAGHLPDGVLHDLRAGFTGCGP